ncbi:MAG: amidohydrolase [Rhodothermia bacterium]|nr:amidohydrolase [Rhodothermia bacterium]
MTEAERTRIDRRSNGIASERELEDLFEVHQDLTDLLRSIRRHLHSNPEIGFEEHKTSEFIAEMLQMHGLSDVVRIAKTGLYVDVEGKHPGPIVGFRADIDALEAFDQKDVEYKSSAEGAAHLCGHDAHTSIGIGVAILLKSLRNHLHGTVRVFFQPNEEGIPSGAPVMIEDGVLDGMSGVYAVHVDPTLQVKEYGLIAGPATAAADRFRVRVFGQTSGHSARPHQSVDTVWVATQMASHLYQLVGRVSDARNTAVLTICRFIGGHAYNVVPSEVEFGGTLRCIDESERSLLKEKLINVCHRIADMYGAGVTVDYEDGAPPVINDRVLVKGVAAAVAELYGEQAIIKVPRPSMGAEDFAHYLKYIPGMLLRVGTASGPDTSHPLHDSRFDIDEESLAPAAQLMACVLLQHLKNEAIRTAAVR